MRSYVTYFDRQFATRGIALIESVLQWDPQAGVRVMALDAECCRLLRARFEHRSVTVYSQEQIEATQDRLPEIRLGRSTWEYYGTLKSVFLSYLMQAVEPGHLLIYADADNWFFSSPAPFLEEMGNWSVGITLHRPVPARAVKIHRFGRFNAGFVCWRKDAIGSRCLADWAEKCLDWCGDQAMPDGRYYDQGYLNSWEQHYERVRVINHPGVNLGPWNLGSHRIEDGRDVPLVGGRALIVYHFSGVVMSGTRWFASRHRRDLILSPVVQEKIYTPYCRALEAIGRSLDGEHQDDGVVSVRRIPDRDDWIPVL